MSSNIKLIYGRKSQRKDNIIFVNEIDFQMPFGEDSFRLSIKRLNEIQKLKIQNKKLPDLFNYQDFSLWWFIHPSIYPEMQKTINFIVKFDEFLEKERPDKVQIKDDFGMFDIINQICKKKEIKFEYSKRDFIKFKTINEIKIKAQKNRYLHITKKKIKNRKELYFKKNNKRQSLNQKIIFAIPSIYRRYTTNIKTRKSETGEYIQQNIMNLIDDEKSIVGIDLDYTFKGDLDILSDRLASELEWIPLELLIDENHNHKEHQQFLEIYKKNISNQNFMELFNFQGISLWKQLEFAFLKMTYYPHLPFYLKLVDFLTTIFQNEKPKAIFLPYEGGPFALAFIIAAKRFGIKTIGLQHALISENNPMYSHERLKNVDDPYGFPFPDRFLLFGEYSKKILVSNVYPNEKLIVFGNAAFFNINTILKILDNKSLYKKYNLKKEQKILLFTTEYLQEYYSAKGKFNYNTEILIHLLEHFSNKENYQIILKPHPSENTSIYEKILDQHNASNFKIIQGDLFELIYTSSLMISVFSNSMMDAICLKKPVIRVTFENVSHVVPYDEFGVVISTKLNELTTNIEEIFNDRKLVAKLSKNRVEFVRFLINIPEYKPETIIKTILEEN